MECANNEDKATEVDTKTTATLPAEQAVTPNA